MNKTWFALLWLCLYAACASAAPPPPTDLTARVGFDQKLGATLPLDARFTDAAGTTASLRQWMDGHPALLLMGYFRCPNLCDVTQQGLAHAMAVSGLRPGRDVSVMFISIDPRETAADATRSQQMVARMPGDANAAAWHFLRGDAAAIAAVTQATGFRYAYDARLGQYAHPAGLVIATADGRVNQYLMGANYVPQTVHLAVVAASRHTLGSMVDQLVLLCCGYDPATGRYTVTIDRIMQGLGFGFVAVLLGLFLLLRRRRPGVAP
ncbi:SCO family protein [Dyella jejuensis]|uniref:SCO family protein n=1 Tax=Dyella jejuensis TaxID=1432009 RepID=A0ABW8JN16_9GAMM